MTVKMVWIYLILAFVSTLVMGCSDLKGTQPDPIVMEETDGDMDSTPVFDPVYVVPPFPAITNVPIIATTEVKDQVVDKELILGVVIDGEARAYPINMLTGPSREIINDTLGNRAIAATW